MLAQAPARGRSRRSSAVARCRGLVRRQRSGGAAGHRAEPAPPRAPSTAVTLDEGDAARGGGDAARSATRSATDSSPVCPMPVQTGIGQLAMARATTSVSKAARSAFEPPPRTTQISVDAASGEQPRGPRRSRRRAGPWTAVGTSETAEAEARALELAQEVAGALGARAADQADVHGDGPGARARWAPKRPSASRASMSAWRSCGQSPEQGVGVRRR